MPPNRTWVSVTRGAMRRLGKLAAALPGANWLAQAAYEAEFAQGRPTNALRGVYADFAEAIRATPPARPTGYDRPEMARLHRGTLYRLDPLDYPVLYWMRPAIEAGALRIFDFGGHVGASYYGFERYLNYPAELTWTICDVPAVVEEGRSLAEANERPQLKFTTRFGDADGTDLLLAAGSLQYLEDEFLHQSLADLGKKPRHLIIQRIPLHDERSFVTLQATGPAFCPYTVAHRRAFIEGLTGMGYELVDSWASPRTLDVPFHPECHVPHYSGLYLRLKE